MLHNNKINMFVLVFKAFINLKQKIYQTNQQKYPQKSQTDKTKHKSN